MFGFLRAGKERPQWELADNLNDKFGVLEADSMVDYSSYDLLKLVIDMKLVHGVI